MKNALGCVLFGFFIVTLSFGAYAQAPAAATTAQAKPVAPALDETELLMVQLVVARAQIAQGECNGLESMKSFNATKAEVVKRIEAKHVGFTIDLQTGKLVAKAVPPK